MRAIQLRGGLDAAAYNEANSGPTMYGPLTCECPVPAADPHIDFGECAVCHRPPLSGFRSLRRAS